MTEHSTHFLAYIPMPMASGAFASDADQDEAVRRAAWFAANDFSHLWDVDGQTVTCFVYDHEPFDNMRCGADGVFGLTAEGEDWVPVEPMETREVILEVE